MRKHEIRETSGFSRDLRGGFHPVPLYTVVLVRMYPWQCDLLSRVYFLQPGRLHCDEFPIASHKRFIELYLLRSFQSYEARPLSNRFSWNQNTSVYHRWRRSLGKVIFVAIFVHGPDAISLVYTCVCVCLCVHACMHTYLHSLLCAHRLGFWVPWHRCVS